MRVVAVVTVVPHDKHLRIDLSGWPVESAASAADL